MLKVRNGYKVGWNGEDKIYIGRYNRAIGYGSVFHNPFHINESQTREQVVEKYKYHLLEKLSVILLSPKDNEELYIEWLQLVTKYREDKDYFLVCYCHPKACHGDVLVQTIDLYCSMPEEEFRFKVLLKELYR